MINPEIDPTLLARIEDAGLQASAPAAEQWVDGWLVRLSPGKAKRARCVNAVSEGGGDLQAHIGVCEALFRDAGLPTIFRLTPFSRPANLDAALAAFGMARFDDTQVMLLSAPQLGASLQGRPPLDGMTLRPVGPESFVERVGAFRGSPPVQRQAHLERLLHSPIHHRAFELALGGEVVACGQFAQEGDIAGLYDVFTALGHRGQGLAGHLCRHLLQLAAAGGVRHVYLQVEADNASARKVYQRLGFVDAYSYHYRWHTPGAATPE